MDFFDDVTDEMVEIVGEIVDGGVTLETVVSAVFNSLGLVVSGAVDFIRAIWDCFSRIDDFINKLISDRKIWLRRTERRRLRPDKFRYGIEIPGVWDHEGGSWAVASLLDRLLGVPIQES